LPDLRTELTFEYVDTEVGLVSDFVSAPLPVTDSTFQNFDPFGGVSFIDAQFNDTQIFRGIGDVSYDITDEIEVKWLGTYERVERLRVLGDPVNFTFDTNGFNDDVIETFTTELSVNFKFDKLSGNFGGYYFNATEDFEFDIIAPIIDFAPPGVIITPADTLLLADTDTLTDTENFAFYGQLRYELNDKWTFGLGLRYDNETFNTTGLIAQTTLDPADCQATVPGFFVGVPLPVVDVPCGVLLPPDAPPMPQADTFTAFLPKASITYNWTDDISTFFAVQRGYRAGGTFLQQTAIDGVPTAIVGTFDPEFLTNFELGLRSQFFDRKLTVNGALFFSILDDQQASLPGPTGGVLDFFTDNVGQSQIYGLELSVDYQPNEEFLVYGSLGLLESEFTDFPFAINATAGEANPFFDLTGNTPPLAPNVTFTIGASYNHSSGVFVDGSLNYSGASESDIANIREEQLLDPTIPGSFTFPMVDPVTGAVSTLVDPADAAALAAGLDEVGDARTNVNLRIGYRHDNFTITAFATNLFDDTGLIQRNFGAAQASGGPDGNGGSLTFFPNPNFTIQQPQTFGIQIDIKFP
ncbi:MAG: TonB-dependent receptor, partial [Pseudomonadota bacterium]